MEGNEATLNAKTSIFLVIILAVLVHFGEERAERPQASNDDPVKQETAVKTKNLPPAVQHTVDLFLGKDAVYTVDQEINDDQIIYHINSGKGDSAKSILLSLEGKVIEIDEVVPFSSLPVDARKKLTKKYAHKNIEDVVRVQSFSYEVFVNKNGTESEYPVTAVGKIEKEHKVNKTTESS